MQCIHSRFVDMPPTSQACQRHPLLLQQGFQLTGAHLKIINAAPEQCKVKASPHSATGALQSDQLRGAGITSPGQLHPLGCIRPAPGTWMLNNFHSACELVSIGTCGCITASLKDISQLKCTSATGRSDSKQTPEHCRTS